jgi:hypothetical protein
VSPPASTVLTMDIPALLITILSILIVATIAFIFGRNPYRWGLYAYFLKFWCLIPLFLLSKRPMPPLPQWIVNLATAFDTHREIRDIKKINTPDDLLKHDREK